jgi:hypothetical protein
MPLSQQQRRTLDRHIMANTIYNWDTSGTDYTARTYIVDCMQRLLDSRVDLTRDLILPNSFINGCCNSSFWFKMAAVICGDKGVSNWHEMEYGPSLNREDRKQRYIYTWMLLGEQYQFYTRTLSTGHVKELVWFMRKSTGSNEGSGNETEPEDIMVGQSTT